MREIKGGARGGWGRILLSLKPYSKITFRIIKLKFRD